MDIRDRILQLIQEKGPVIPVQIAKEINSSILLTSAYLSELVSQKKLKMSVLKIGGGSSLYYIPGQESRLQEFANNLNEKNMRTFEYLKENKVLRDSELTPLMRVSVREIRDFAKPLEVMFDNKKEIFWKWHTIDNKEAEQVIKQKLNTSLPIAETENHKKETKENKAEKVEKKENVQKKSAESQKQPIERQEKLPQEKKTTVDVQQDQSSITMWQNADSPFIRKIKNYINIKNIKLSEVNINRKDSDIELIMNIESSIGEVTYFCRAKNKKKINEGDLSSVFMQGQMKKLPAFMIMTGNMTKKAKEMLATELKGLSVVRIE